MPHRYVVISTDFLIGPRMRSAPRRAKTAWLALAADVTTVSTHDGPPRIQGCQGWTNVRWRGFGLNRGDIDAAVESGLLRWQDGDLIVLGMAPRADGLDHGDGVAPLPPSGDQGLTSTGLSEAARAQRQAAAKARWTGGRQGGAGCGPHADGDAERCGPHDAEDAGRICGPDAEPMRAASDSASPSPRPPSQERQDKTGQGRDLRAPAPASAHAERHAESDAEPMRAASDSASGSASPSASPHADGEPATAPTIGPPEAAEARPPPRGGGGDPWQGERRQPWAKILLAAACKIGPNNWPAWKALTDQYPAETVARVAKGVNATIRWPDKVEEALRANGARRTASEAFQAKAIRIET